MKKFRLELLQGNNFLSLLLKRSVQCVLVVFIVGFLSFAMFRYIGDPVQAMTNVVDASKEDIQEIRIALGLDKPFYIQYFMYLKGIVLDGDFGNSYQYKIPVSQIISKRVSATVELSLLSFIIAIVLGIAIGVYTAIHPNKPTSNFFVFTASLGISVPTFVIGLFLIYLFSVIIPILPAFGRGGVVNVGSWSTNFLSISGIRAIVLPACTLSVYQISFVQRVVNAEMTAMLKTEFVRYAHLRGLSKKVVYYRHALKNILPQLITILALQLGGLIAFSSITESVFQWPGLGLLFIQSLQRADIPILSTYLMLIAILFVVLNFVADLLHLVIDPRAREKSRGQGTAQESSRR